MIQSDNPYFNPQWSTDDIWRDQDQTKCLSNELNIMGEQIACKADRSELEHTHIVADISGLKTKLDNLEGRTMEIVSLYSGTLSSGSCEFAYGSHKGYIVIGNPSDVSLGAVTLFIPAEFITEKRTMQLADNQYAIAFEVVGVDSTGTITIDTNNDSGSITQVYGVN